MYMGKEHYFRAGHDAYSSVGKIGLSCLLGSLLIMVQDLIYYKRNQTTKVMARITYLVITLAAFPGFVVNP